MKKNCLALGMALLSASVAAAQDVPQVETFFGYSYVRFNSATNLPSFSANGAGGQFAYNFNTWLSGVADLGAVHNGSIGSFNLDNTMANFLFGPRVSFRFARIRPYFNVLFGGVYATSSALLPIGPATPSQPVFLPGIGAIASLPIPGQPIATRVSAQQTAFAMAAGGGLDIKLNKHVSFRPIGLDYFMTRLQNLRTQGDNNQNNLRYTAGVNFTFGAQ